MIHMWSNLILVLRFNALLIACFCRHLWSPRKQMNVDRTRVIQSATTGLNIWYQIAPAQTTFPLRQHLRWTLAPWLIPGNPKRQITSDEVVSSLIFLKHLRETILLLLRWVLLCPRPHKAEALSDDARVWHICLSVAYIGPKSRTERPRKTKINAEVAYVTCDSDTTFKVKRSKVNL